MKITIAPGHERIVNVQGRDEITIIGVAPRVKSGAERFVLILFGFVLTCGGLGLLLGGMVWGLREVWEHAL
jgi:hypothetical protein